MCINYKSSPNQLVHILTDPYHNIIDITISLSFYFRSSSRRNLKRGGQRDREGGRKSLFLILIDITEKIRPMSVLTVPPNNNNRKNSDSLTYTLVPVQIVLLLLIFILFNTLPDINGPKTTQCNATYTLTRWSMTNNVPITQGGQILHYNIKPSSFN